MAMVETKHLHVDPAHAEQLAAWDGDEGAYWADHADRFERSLAGYHEAFMAAGRIEPDSRVLDVGCGTGGSTLDAARLAVDGSALGVDLSSAMLRVARERAERERIGNAAFLQADAQVHPFDPASYDVALGRTSAMFFADKAAAFANIGRALRPGGRLVLLVWQSVAANEWLREIAGALAAGRARPEPPPDGPQPFSLSDPARTRSHLVAAGFTGIEVEAVSHPMRFGDDADDTFPFLVGQLGWMLGGLDESGRRRALDDLRSLLRAHEGPDGVTFGSACWLVRASNRPQG